MSAMRRPASSPVRRPTGCPGRTSGDGFGQVIHQADHLCVGRQARACPLLGFLWRFPVGIMRTGFTLEYPRSMAHEKKRERRLRLWRILPLERSPAGAARQARTSPGRSPARSKEAFQRRQAERACSPARDHRCISVCECHHPLVHQRVGHHGVGLRLHAEAPSISRFCLVEKPLGLSLGLGGHTCGSSLRRLRQRKRM